MKKFLLALILIGLLVAPVVLTATPIPTPAPVTPPDIRPMEALVRVINWAFGILAALAILMGIISGIMFVTARGDENQLKTAKSILTFAIIGFVIALLARGLFPFIQGVLGG